MPSAHKKLTSCQRGAWLAWLLQATAGFALAVSTAAMAQSAEPPCGAITSSFGPYDYRLDRDKLPIVENHHFPPQVEALIRGSTGTVAGDIDYTLAAFPNHHRALLSLVRWGQKTKSPQPGGLRRPIECYFDRAMRFKPDDALVRLIYAKFLTNNARSSEADAQLSVAAVIDKDNGFTQYNIGLIYLEMRNFEKALAQAHKADSLGFAGTALRDDLKKAGQWKQANAAQPAASQKSAD